MLPDGPSSSENIMTLPTDVNLRLPIVSSSPLSSSSTPTSPATITTTTTTSHNNYFISNQIKIDQIFPGIYLTNIGEYWTNNRLRSHGFTHIIIIDKHIQNYATMMTENRIRVNSNPSMMSNNSSSSSSSSSNSNNRGSNSNNISSTTTSTTTTSNRNNDNNNNNNALNANLTPFSSLLLSSSSLSSFSSDSIMKSIITTTNNNNKFANEFEILDLNFGEESYLTTVLPNCYKAVKFIDKALQYGGAILIIDRISNQKCLTIVTAYLMYKNNLNFNDAFQRIRKIYDETVELEKFFISQLYEYEPILQVQRAQSKGHSCSRELRMTYLKRKKLHDDHHNATTTTCTSSSNMIYGVGGDVDVITASSSSSSSSLITHSDNYNYYNLNSTIYITNNEISATNSNNFSSSSHDYITSGGDVSME